MQNRSLYLPTAICLLTGSIGASAADIHNAARAGDLAKVIALLETDPNLATLKDPSSKTALHWAAQSGHSEVVKSLLNKGAQIDAADSRNTTPLHFAADGGHLDTMRQLMERGASLQAKDADGDTPLHYAAVRNHGACVSSLLEKGAQPDALNFGNQTALHLAAQGGAKDAVAALVKAGAAKELRDNMGRTPLVLGVRERGGPEVAQTLIQAGADIQSRDKNGWSALMMAAMRGSREIVDMLLDHKAALPSEAAHLQSLMAFATERGLVRLFRAITAQGGLASTSNGKGGTYLHDAAAGGAVEIVTDLVAKGLDVNSKNRYGWTPAHYAARNGRVEVIRWLHQKGADLNARTIAGQSALNIANENGFTGITKALLEAKVDPRPMQFPLLRGNYLGQTPPGKTPQLFAPGIVSSIWGLHSTAVFSPDGREVFWSPMVMAPGAHYSVSVLMHMNQVEGRWTAPALAPFATPLGDDVPCFAPDGKRLFFLSRRPLPGQRQGNENIWYVERTAAGWSEARPFDSIVNAQEKHWQFSLDRVGNVYFASSASGGKGQNDIYVCRFEQGKYQLAANLGPRINTDKVDMTPFIAPDGSYLLFSRDQALFVSFHQKDGCWTEAIDLGPTLNMPGGAIDPMVTPDGKYLFFMSSRNGINGAYWVDTSILDTLRPKHGERKPACLVPQQDRTSGPIVE